MKTVQDYQRCVKFLLPFVLCGVFIFVPWILHKVDLFKSQNSKVKRSTKYYDYSEDHQAIIHKMSRNRIRENSKYYSRYPHGAGSLRNKELGSIMARTWKRYGLDKVETSLYKALLSFPKRPARLTLSEGSRVIRKIEITNEPLSKYVGDYKSAILPYYAFTPSVNLTAEIVFCNFGSSEDYKKLQNSDIKLEGKIFILKNTESEPRRTVINRAIKHGASALLYYSDPNSYTGENETEPLDSVFNKFGILRRKLPSKLNFYGDILSLGYPSKPGYFRENVTNIRELLYDLPVQPISASMADTLKQFVDINQSNKNTSYSSKKTITLEVENELKDGEASVVCGSLFGSEEPDHYVVIGNHRDAWNYGASDPVSGSAIMTEIARVLGMYKKSGHRFRRSLLICSWDAEEQGLIGSAEWFDENSKFISEKVIAYLNVDVAVEGNHTVSIKSSDQMIQSISEASKNVQSVINPNQTIFEDIHEKQTDKKSDLLEYDRPGITSDNILFSHALGIAVSDYRFTFDKDEYPKADTYGHYHTMYDNFYTMSKFVDPTFRYHLSLGRLWLSHAMLLLDSPIIPFELSRFVKEIQKDLIEIEKINREKLEALNVSLSHARKRMEILLETVVHFEAKIKSLDIAKIGFYKLKSINNIIQTFSQIFMHKTEVGVQFIKEIYLEDQNMFPSIRYALLDPGVKGVNLNRELTILIWSIDMAMNSLDIEELKIDL